MTVPGNLSSPLLATAADSAAAAYQISRSIRFNSADSARLERTPSSAGNRKTFTWSAWIKFLKDDGEQQLFNAGTNTDYIRLNGNRTAWIKINSAYYGPSAVFRDYGAWYHWVIAVDTTQSTSSDRVKMWVNGVQQTLNQGSGFPSQNASSNFNNTTKHAIGIQNWNNASPSDFYLTENHWIDGQALSATDFGEYDSNNVWQPKEYSGTYGTNGFRLTFADNTSTTTIAEDSSGNNNHWTANNISVSSGSGNDSLIDTPTNYTPASGNAGGNYATWNPLAMTSGVSLTNGNLDASSSAADKFVVSTIFPSTGKWYAEFLCNSAGTEDAVGIVTSKYQISEGFYSANQISAYRPTGAITTSSFGSVTFPTWTTGDIIRLKLDLDNQKFAIAKNNGSFTEVTITDYDSHVAGESWSFRVGNGSSGGSGSFNYTANWGQRSFSYTLPTGFLSLCTTNLPDPTIADGSTAFDATLWTGNGSTQTISGLNHSPDFIWHKIRSISGGSQLYDAVRGTSKRLQSDSSAAESTLNGVTAFNSDGWTMTAGNNNNETYVSWTWDAGTSTASNTDGSITSSVRANPSAGFSIVAYTGDGNNATIGHGLNAAPEFIIQKRRSQVQDWNVYHSANGKDKSIILNSTAASYSSTTWNNTAPTSSVFSIVAVANPSGQTHIAYCFAPVEGFSAFGSYTGTGTSGDSAPFVYTGFRPRWVLIKESSASGNNWNIWDAARDQYNVTSKQLKASSNGVEVTNTFADFTSNGFKIRVSTGGINTSSNTYIYAAFAEHPFKTARAR